MRAGSDRRTANIISETITMPEPARALRHKYLEDTYRPGYHFTVPEGSHSPVDPNGALFWNGRYHLCYIYQEEETAGSESKRFHYWGHVSSTDLLHWRHHPPALGPGEGDEGIFSGGAFIDRNGTPTITYWGLGNPRGICIATSTEPHLDHWEKSTRNPVIRETQSGLTVAKDRDGNEIVYGAADPSAPWWHDGRYHLLTGNLLVLNEFGIKRNMPQHKGDTAYLFQSDDLIDWAYKGEFYKSRREWTDESEDCMCPDFFPLPPGPDGGEPTDTYVLLCISHNKGCRYYLGDYSGDRFTPSIHERMTWLGKTWGNSVIFAPETLVDAAGRRIMWAWVFGWHEQSRGWSGSLSLPRLLWLAATAPCACGPCPSLTASATTP